MFGLRAPELLIILVLVLVLFGKDRLPHLGSSLGQGIRNFKRGFSGEDEAPPGNNPGATNHLASGNGATNAAPASRQPTGATKDV